MVSTFFAIAYGIAGVCSFLACFLSIWTMYKHLQYYAVPRIQIYIVRIVLMVPVSNFLNSIPVPRQTINDVG